MRGRGTSIVEHGWAPALVCAFAVAVVGWTGFELAQWPPDPPESGVLSSAPAEPPETPVTGTSWLVVGDSYAGGAGATTPRETGFAPLLAACAGADLTVEAGPEVGYLATGGGAVGGRVRAVLGEEQPDVVVFAAGLQDRLALLGGAGRRELRDAAAAAWAEAGRSGARVVVLGPFWPSATLGDPTIRTVRDALRDEAAEQGHLFVDPTGWLTRPRLAPDRAHPDQDGHRFVADRLGEALEAAGISQGC